MAVATFEEFLDALNEVSATRSAAGFAFEPAVKWFLETDPRYSSRLKKIWLWKDWPKRWGPDTGIDLIAEDVDGKIWAIQSKQYDPKGGLLSKTHIDSFLADSINELIDCRLLVTTSQGLGRNATQTVARQNRVCPINVLSYADLVSAPVEWPSDPVNLKGGKPRQASKPRPHQRKALKDLDGLADRGQLIMACGTGKTLTALWASERLNSQRTLVLLPSLTLLSQTVTEWTANQSREFAYLPVCSDETVSRGSDAAMMFTSDLQFPVTTDRDEIAAFLRRRGRRVIFSTYQSSPQIAAAQGLGRVPHFDLVIADEAHRCAGRTSSDYATVLHGDQIRAKKRLFMTATPRTFTARVRGKASERGLEIASMDDSKVFGPVMHELNFGSAIEQDLLSDYQLVVVGVDDEAYGAMINERQIVEVEDGFATDAETLATQVAIAKAIRNYELKRIITFHSRIKRASQFAKQLPRTISWMSSRWRPKGKVMTDYVSGEMPTGERNRRLSNLREVAPGDHAVLSNARCLSEGIDVPTLDGVAFVDPRRSQVDIVQAVGRAIRRSESKSKGTIIVPVYIRRGDDPNEMLTKSEFEPVWAVVRALRAHDETLGEALDEVRLQLGKSHGTVPSLPPKIVLDLPSSIDETFASAIRTHLVEHSTQSWNEHYGALLKFVEVEGHSKVPDHHVVIMESHELPLGNWVHNQRSFGKNGTLPEDRKRKLESVRGWVWDIREFLYQRSFEAMSTYIEKEGHSRIEAKYVTTHDGEEITLGHWAAKQRHEYRRGNLPDERIKRLQQLDNWVWEPLDEIWQLSLEALRQFIEREESFPLQKHAERFSGNDFRIGNWVNMQRTLKKKGELSQERIEQLESIPGWLWEPRVVFEQNFEFLRSFVDREGHARVPQTHLEKIKGEEFHLGAWIGKQRSKKANERLSAEYEKKLEALPGWEWTPVTAAYERHLKGLRQFAAREGHSMVPFDHQETVDGINLDLGQWVSVKRGARKRNKLTTEQIQDLEELKGWTWNKRDENFALSLAALQQFADREGRSLPRNDHVETLGVHELKIGLWVYNRKRDFQQGRLSHERIAVLEDLPNWTWDVGQHLFSN
jgi:superfamily II DNA or RNA helicase